MGSTQVLSNSSRKQGHLEAGKRRLEEFRKKKAEGQAKKPPSTGQLQSVYPSQYSKLQHESEKPKLPNPDGHQSWRGSFAPTESSGSILNYDSKTTNSFQSTKLGSSNLINTASPISVYNSNEFHGDLSNKSSWYQEPKLYDGYDCWSEEKNGESTRTDTEPKSGTADDQPTNPDSIHLYSSIDETVHQPSFNSLSEARSEENGSFSKEYLVRDSMTPNLPLISILRGQSATAFMESKVGFVSSSASTSTSYADSIRPTTHVMESAPKLDQNMDNGTNCDIASFSNMRWQKLGSTIDHHIDADIVPLTTSESLSTSEPFSSGSSLNFKGSFNQIALPKIISSTGTTRSSPSFLDSLIVPRVSSVSSSPFIESGKAEPLASVKSSKVHSIETLVPSASLQSLRYSDTVKPFSNTRTQDLVSTEKSPRKSSGSVSNKGLLSQGVRDDIVQKKLEFPSLEKHDDFATLEQHIEDLTQEKFSLQRALEASRALAESLANENSTLTDSFNQQGAIVSQLKSDMEKLEKEIRDQLVELEDVSMKFSNEQLEHGAANERANILASEVIELEAKAMRLRSNELKLEKELEKSNAEITSYKRKVSSLSKERQDLQSTIDALQEEKKMLQSKLRKAAQNGKDSNYPITKDVSISTEDLDAENRLDVETGVADIVPSTFSNQNEVIGSSIGPSSNMHSFALPSKSTEHRLPCVSAGIPPDQLRMIDNINCLISELSLEREELTQALQVESSNISKLKDLNTELSQRLEAQTQRLELLTAQHMANESFQSGPSDAKNLNGIAEFPDEGDEVVERVLGWIIRLFPGGLAKRRTSKLL